MRVLKGRIKVVSGMHIEAFKFQPWLIDTSFRSVRTEVLT